MSDTYELSCSAVAFVHVFRMNESQDHFDSPIHGCSTLDGRPRTENPVTDPVIASSQLGTLRRAKRKVDELTAVIGASGPRTSSSSSSFTRLTLVSFSSLQPSKGATLLKLDNVVQPLLCNCPSGSFDCN